MANEWVLEWISVKDRLPEAGSYVLAYLDFGYGYSITTSIYIKNGFVTGEKDVTHWMPLPQPPKGE